MADIYANDTLIHAVVTELEKRGFLLEKYGYSVYLLACAGLNEDSINGLDAISVLKELEKTFCPILKLDDMDAVITSITENKSTVASDIIEYLIKSKYVDVNNVYNKSRGITALYYAIITGRLDVLERLISLGANVNAQCDGRCPIACANSWKCDGNKDTIIYALLTAGAEIPADVIPKPYQQYITDLHVKIDHLNKKYEDEFAPGGLGAKRAAEHFDTTAKRQKDADRYRESTT